MTKEDKEKFWKDFKKDFVAGSLSGAAVTLTTQPLDTIAVRSQAGVPNNNPYKSFSGAFKPVSGPKLKGFAKAKNLYRGVTPRLVKSTAAGAIGYPVFMAAASEIEKRQKEKNAELITIQTTPNAGKVLPKLYHSANPGEFKTSRKMKTSDAIDYLTKSWTHRPINVGKGKEYYGPQKIASAGLLNIGIKAFKGIGTFAKGFTLSGVKSMGGWKGALKSPGFVAGGAGSVGKTMAAPKMSKTFLETGTRSTRRLSSSMVSPKTI